MKTEIESLTGLRGLAACWVLSFHLYIFSGSLFPNAKPWLAYFANAGYLGVDVFFLLSGFVLAYNYKEIKSADYCAFIWKRFARIYPVHLATLAILSWVYVLAAASGLHTSAPKLLTTHGLLATLALTHAWSYPIAKSWHLVSWSISAEWAAYLLFPMVLLASNRIRGAFAAAVLIGLLYLLLHFVTADHRYVGTMAYGIPRIATEFTAGVILHRLWVIHGPVPWGRVLVYVAAFALVFGASSYDRNAGGMFAIDYFPILGVIVVFGLASQRRSGGMLSSPAMVYLGRISYALYMVHYIVLQATRKLLAIYETPSVLTATFVVIAVIGVSIALAAVIYQHVEVPMRRWLISLANSPTEQRSSSASRLPGHY